ncbi:hypothetical protein [Nannocystis punicea]|uniref:Uncharacterized protein n=1 Tax=Nannocystis punicea TaxID=2995304 RepID=A0ABY7H4V8_9BACT|nr:hypothetical protein [Nannocystis poenicansa]WAS94130.1 hypothetical protein O0S08_49035 [Nannocystis poenicansa]
MTRSSDIFARSGRRIAAALAGSAVLLLGSWYLLSGGEAPEPAAPAAGPEPAVSLGVQAADADPARRQFDDFDPRPDHVAAAPPRIEPVPEDKLTSDRKAWLADPGPQIEVDTSAQVRLEAARAAATSELQKALDDRRGSLLRACGGKDASNIFVQATFGPDGKLLGRQFADHGNATDVLECLQSQPFAMSIPPPGVELSVRGVLAP